MGDGSIFAMQPFLVAFQMATIFGCISNCNHFWLHCKLQLVLVAANRRLGFSVLTLKTDLKDSHRACPSLVH
jgi:hypothetical protein